MLGYIQLIIQALIILLLALAIRNQKTDPAANLVKTRLEGEEHGIMVSLAHVGEIKKFYGASNVLQELEKKLQHSLAHTQEVLGTRKLR